MPIPKVQDPPQPLHPHPPIKAIISDFFILLGLLTPFLVDREFHILHISPAFFDFLGFEHLHREILSVGVPLEEVLLEIFRNLLPLGVVYEKVPDDDHGVDVFGVFPVHAHFVLDLQSFFDCCR